MNLEKLRKFISDPRRTAEDLRELMRRCVEIDDVEGSKVIDGELKARFPFGRSDNRATPVVAKFKGVERVFKTSKDGYIWLLDKFCSHHPELFSAEGDWRRNFVSESRNIKFFSENLRELFPNSQGLMEKKCNYVLLRNGLYARTHLSNSEKLRVLHNLAAACNMTYQDDWRWLEMA